MENYWRENVTPPLYSRTKLALTMLRLILAPLWVYVTVRVGRTDCALITIQAALKYQRSEALKSLLLTPYPRW
jgi:thiamine monophosphate kinase